MTGSCCGCPSYQMATSIGLQQRSFLRFPHSAKGQDIDIYIGTNSQPLPRWHTISSSQATIQKPSKNPSKNHPKTIQNHPKTIQKLSETIQKPLVVLFGVSFLQTLQTFDERSGVAALKLDQDEARHFVDDIHDGLLQHFAKKRLLIL